MVRDDGPPTDDHNAGSDFRSGASALDVLPENLDSQESALGQEDEGLRFDLRFEKGDALLGLDDTEVVEGFRIEKALFSVPDVEFPLDVTQGPELFRNRRLRARALDVEFNYELLFSTEKLRAAGLTLIRHRARSGGIEFLFSIEGPSAPVTLRARGIFSPAGNAEIAFILHEVIPFGRAPKSRIDLARDLLDALDLPGGRPAYGMVRKADCFRWALGRLLPKYGWKIPRFSDLQLQEVICEKNKVRLRAWTEKEPEGWVRADSLDKSPIDDAVGIAIFVEQMESSAPDKNPVEAVDAILDEGDPPATVAPFAAEILRADPRRRFEGDEIVTRGLERHPTNLGLLSAHVEESNVDLAVWRKRLCRLASVALGSDEHWVAVGAYLAAAKSAAAENKIPEAIEAATNAWYADPAQGECGMFLSRLHHQQQDWSEALRIGREALPHIVDQEDASQFAVQLAGCALSLGEVHRARRLYRRSLRKIENIDALLGLTDLELSDGKAKAAAALLTRLLALDTEDRPVPVRCEIQVLAGKLAAATSQQETALFHWGQARNIAPRNEKVARLFAEAHHDAGQVNKAIDVLRPFVTTDPPLFESIQLMARLYLSRAEVGDAEQCRGLLKRIGDDAWNDETRLIDAKASYALGDALPLAQVMFEEASRESDANEQLALFLRALRLAQDVGEPDLIAKGLVGLSRCRIDATTDVLDYFLRQEEQSAELRAYVRLIKSADVKTSRISILGTGLAAEKRYRDAHDVLSSLHDLDSRLERADLAGRAGLYRTELEERKDLVLLLGEDTEEIASALTRAQYIRIAELHLTDVGEGAGAAAMAYAAAAHRGEPIGKEWLAAAVQSGHPRRIFEVLRFDSSLLSVVDVDVLRTVCGVQEIFHVDDEVQFRIKMRRELAERTGFIDDVENYLQDIRKNVDAILAAQIFREMALAHLQPNWLVEAAQTFVVLGEPERGLSTIVQELSGPLGREVLVAESAFALAKEYGNIDSVWRTSTHLLAVLDIDPVFRNAIHSDRSNVLLKREPAEGARALQSWLKDDPGASKALQLLVPHLLQLKLFEQALNHLEQAIETGNVSAEIEEVAAALVDAARLDENWKTEIAAQELRLRCSIHEDGDGRAEVLKRLLELHEKTDDTESTVKTLLRLTECDLAGLLRANYFRRVAELSIDVLGDRRLAVDAWKGTLQFAPNDGPASQKLRAALTENMAWSELIEELERAAGVAESGVEKIALYLKAGDVAASELDDHVSGKSFWFKALRIQPFAEGSLERLLNESRDGNVHSLRVRAYVTALRTVGTGTLAGQFGCEAAAILAGVMEKPRLAILVYERAFQADNTSKEALYALIELYRSLHDAHGALRSVEHLMERLDGPDYAFALEIRADIYEDLFNDPEMAAGSRREALRLNPLQRVSALALERYYRQTKDIRKAIVVRRELADQSVSAEDRAQTYSFLSQSAADELDDFELAEGLAKEALHLQPRLQHVRLSRIRYLEHLNMHQAMIEEIHILLETGVLEPTERNVLVRRKAAIERDVFRDFGGASQTLKRELGRAFKDRIGWDVLLKELVDAQEQNGDWLDGYENLKTFIKIVPHGNEAWGSRRKLLQRLAEFAENCGETEESIAHIKEARALGNLSRASWLRWARLAEAKEDFSDAVVPLRAVVADENLDLEDLIAALGRQGRAEEEAGFLDEALAAWRLRAERRPGELESHLHIERISKVLDVPEVTRASCEILNRLQTGNDSERFVRLLWLARDTLQRKGNPAAALDLYEKARAIFDEKGIRREMLDCAEAAADDTTSLALLERMQQAGDSLKRADWLRLAETRAFVENRYKEAFDNLYDGLGDEDILNPREEMLLSVICENDASIVAEALIAETEPAQGHLALERSPKLRALFDALSVTASLPPEALLPIADRFRDNPHFVMAAAADERKTHPLKAVDRLIDFSDANSTDGVVLTEKALEIAADILCQEDVTNNEILERLDSIWDYVAAKPVNRSVILRVLRDAEAWEKVAQLFEASIQYEEEREREIRLELAYVYREMLENPEIALEHLDGILLVNEEDREAWGEVFECLEDLGDPRRLVERVERRIQLVSGLERRELVRKRTRLLIDLGQGPQALNLLTEARNEAPQDSELRDFEWQIHESQGLEEFARFLQREIAVTIEGDTRIAEAILSLEDSVVSVGARAAANQILLAQNEKTLKSIVLEIFRRKRPAEEKAEELCVFLRTVDGDTRTNAISIVARCIRVIGASISLTIIDHLRQAGIDEIDHQLGLFVPALRVAVENSRVARKDFYVLSQLGALDADGLIAELHCALRARDKDWIRASSNAGHLSEKQKIDLHLALQDTKSADWRKSSLRNAKRAVEKASQEISGILFAVRMGRRGMVETRIQTNTQSTLSAAAEQSLNLRITNERLSTLILLVPYLDDVAKRKRLRILVSKATEAGDMRVELSCLHQLADLGDLSNDEKRLRAANAIQLNETNAVAHCVEAAESEVDLEKRDSLCRQALSLIAKKNGTSRDEKQNCLISLAFLAEGNGSLLHAIIDRASEESFLEIEDYCLERIVESEPSQLKKLTELRRWSHFRLADMNDAQGAFAVLEKAHQLYPKSDFGEEAYWLAVEHGLLEEQIRVIGDPFAAAGLCAAQKDFVRARSFLTEDNETLTAIAAQYLLADIEYAEGLLEQGDRILMGLRDNAKAGSEVWRKLFFSKKTQAAFGAAIELAAEGLEKFGNILYFEEALLECHAEVPVSLQVAFLQKLAHLNRMGRFAFSELPEDEIVNWLKRSEKINVIEFSVIAARELAERWDDDASWGKYLSFLAAHVSPDEFWAEFEHHYRRQEVWRVLRESCPDAFSDALDIPMQRGDVKEMMPFLWIEQTRRPLQWSLRYRLSVALEAGGHNQEAAEILSDCSPENPADKPSHQLRMAGLWARSENFAAAVDALMRLPLSAFDDDARRVTLLLAHHIGAVALPAVVRMATALGHTPNDVDEVFHVLEKNTDSDLAVSVSKWRLAENPMDQRAWELVKEHGDASSCAFFGEHAAIYGESIWPAQLSLQAALVRAFRKREIAIERPAPASDTLGKARWGDKDVKTQSWRRLAEAAQEEKRFADSARFLARSGVPLHDQPIEIRLAADPVLADPIMRVDAVVGEIMELDSDAHVQKNRLVDLFTQMNEQGWVGATHRLRVGAKIGGTSARPSLIDAYDQGKNIQIARTIKKMNRAATAEERTVLAALAIKSGKPRWAFFLNPMLQSYQIIRTPKSYAKELQTRAETAQAKGAYSDALMLYRAALPVLGTSIAMETKIQEMGTLTDNWTLLAESMLREICQHENVERRFERLMELLNVVENQIEDDVQALRLCRAAAREFDGKAELGRYWLALAEKTKNGIEVLAALRYFDSFEFEVEDRSRRHVRCSKIMRYDYQSPEIALRMISSSIDELGPQPVLKMEQVLCFSALGRMEEAGETCMEVLEGLVPTHLYRHQVRRDASRFFQSIGDNMMAGDLLLLSAREGDRESLRLARDLAVEVNDWERLEHVYRYWDSYEGNPETLRQLCLERAQFYEKRLDNPGEAIRVLESQVLRDENDYDCINKLAGLYLQEHRVLDAGLAYESAGAIEGRAEDERAVALREAACLLAGIGELERAGPLAERALSLGAEDMMLLTILSGWYRSQERYTELDEILGKEGDLLEKIQDATYPWMERALLRRDVLMDAAGAREALYRILDIQPNHTKALEALTLDAQRSGEYTNLISALDTAIAFSENAAFKHERLEQIAEIQADVLSDYRAALQTIQRFNDDEIKEPRVIIKRALYSLALGDRPAALKLASELFLIDHEQLPGSLHLLLAEDARAAGNMAEAVHRCRLSLSENECEREAETLLLDIADEMPFGHDPKELIATLAEVASRAKPDIDGERAARIYCVAARYELAQEDADAAAKWASKAVAADPSLMEALDLAADSFERTGRFAESELYLRRLGAMGTPEDQLAILVRRAGLLEQANKRKEALRLYLRIVEEDASEEHRKHAVDLAVSLGARDVLSRLGVLHQDSSEEDGNNQLEYIRDLVIHGKYAEAIETLKEVYRVGRGNGEFALQGVLASRGANAAEEFLLFAERRIKDADGADEIEDLYREAGRIARDQLKDHDRAVKYLYRAHQVAPDDIELQLEVADLYTRIPHLHEHAQVGLEQLSAKIPGDHRLYMIARILAEHVEEHDKCRAMQDAIDLLLGTAIPARPTAYTELLRENPHADEIETAHIVQALTGRETPPQWHILLENIGGVIESRLVRHDVDPSPIRPLQSCGYEYVQMAEHLDKQLAGRPLEFVVGSGIHTRYEPGATTKVILPEKIFSAGPEFVYPAMARAVFVVRAGFVLGETLADEDIQDFLEHLKFLMGEEGAYGLTCLSQAGLSSELAGDLIADAQAASAKNILLRWRRMTKKTSDRYALIASGSIMGSLVAGPYPDALEEAPLMIAAGLKNHTRALDLCAYALSKEGWRLRSSWGFSSAR